MKNETYIPLKTAIKDFLYTYLEKHGKKLIDEVHIKSMKCHMLNELIDGFLDEEMDAVLGYSRYDNRNKETNNIRNGRFIKNIRTGSGDLKINIPRDRQGKFEPIIIKKYQNCINCEMEKKLISLYAEGFSDEEIETRVRSLYQEELTDQMVKGMKEKVRSIVGQWQQRPLTEVYAVAFLDTVTCCGKREYKSTEHTVYMLYGITLSGVNDILGIYVKQKENNEFWISVLEELKRRGVKDILIPYTKGPAEFAQAVSQVYGEAEPMQNKKN